ncbi:MAG: ATP F0F1 synthase subunit B [Proteobacteria bacterium]|nr:ATP F0F1 synthase subunit B [Pseudomonadota bacterium]
MSLLQDSHFVVAISFVLFFGLLAYLGVHKFLGKALDDRADRIRQELDDVRRLREEAQAIFAEFERKHREVDTRAGEIVAHAKAEAGQAAEQAKADLAASIERRLRGADEQIAMAEANAVREVRDRAVQVAIAAAAEVMAARLSEARADALVEDAIKSVGERLH